MSYVCLHLITKSCLTLYDPMYFSSPGSSIHGISQEDTGVGGHFLPKDLLDPGVEPVSPILAGGYFTTEPQGKPNNKVLRFSLEVSVQSLSRVQLFAIPWTADRQASLSITNSWSLLKLMSIESVMPFNHLILCHPLLLPSNFPSIRVFSNESVLCIRWPKYWSFSYNISPSNEYSGLISFRMDWLDLLAVQGTHKSLLQHHISKASILWHSAFFILHLSRPYTSTGKIIALARRTFVGKGLEVYPICFENLQVMHAGSVSCLFQMH